MINEAAIVRLLRRELQDDGNWRNRNNTIGAHGWQLVSAAFWERLYPVTYSEERIFALGRAAVDPLLDIVKSDDEAPIVTKGTYTLAYFDDPWIVPTVYDAARQGRFTPLDLALWMPMHLPIARPGGWIPAEEVLDWLSKKQGVPYDALCLQLLDSVMTAEWSQGGLPVDDVADERVVRWLNRLYDIDLDDWLDRVAPRALAFRNAELAKGYDPAVVFSRLVANLDEGVIDEGIKLVFSDRQDRAACHELLEAVYNPSFHSKLHPPAVAGWQDRLRAWYWEHRNALVYDFQKHRFVVKN